VLKLVRTTTVHVSGSTQTNETNSHFFVDTCSKPKMGNNLAGEFTNVNAVSNRLPESNMSTTNVAPAAASSSDLAQLTQHTASFQNDTNANINTLRAQLQQVQNTCLTYSKAGLLRYEDVANMNGSMKCTQDINKGTLVYCSSAVMHVAGPNFQPPPQGFSGVCHAVHDTKIAEDPLFACDVNADLLQHHQSLLDWNDVRQMNNFNCYQDVNKGGMVYCTTGTFAGANITSVPQGFTGVCQLNPFGNLLTCDVNADTLTRHQSPK